MNNIYLIIKDLFFIFLDSLIFLFTEILYFFFPSRKKHSLDSLVDKKDDSLDISNPYDLHKLIEMQSLGESSSYDKQDYDVKSSKKALHRGFKIGIFIFIACFSMLIYIFWDLPNYKILENYQPPLTTRIYSSDNYIISELATEKRLFVPLSHISPFVVDAFLSAEDKNFYNHSGFDYIGLIRATYKNILYYLGLSKNIEGASTISQQVVKNFLLNNDRTIKRKIREAILTIQIEYAFSKRYILDLYLNEIYLGKSSYGVAMASLNYFDKPVSDLSLAEAAFLASLPKAPSKYDPDINYDLSKNRRDWVIARMLLDGKITQHQADEAINTPIVLKTRINMKVLKTQYATEEIRKNIIKNFGYDSIYNKGLMVKTTINYKYQEYAYDSLQKGITDYDQKDGYRDVYKRNEESKDLNLSMKINNQFIWQNILKNKLGVSLVKLLPLQPAIILRVDEQSMDVGLNSGAVITLLLSENLWILKNKPKKYNFLSFFQVADIILLDNKDDKLFISQIPQVNGALLAMDPQSGDILAMQGGYSFAMSEFNRAIQAKRQPGSAFKPFIYLTAIENGYKPTDLILDAPYVVENKDDASWRPKNYLNSYRGFVTLRNALEYSRNLVTIRVANDVGLEKINQTAKKLKIYQDDILDLTGALGSKEVSLINLVRGYSILANGGKMIEPNLFHLVQNIGGDIVYKKDTRECDNCKNVQWQNQLPPEITDNREQVLNSADAYLVVNLLQGVVERGSGIGAKVKNFNMAGKTGTTNDVKDAWFIGFTPDLVVGVYVGADEPKSLGGTSASATSIAVPIFQSFMKKALETKTPLPFRTPEGIVNKWVNYTTGKIDNLSNGNVILESFKEDNVQQEIQTDSNKEEKGLNNKETEEGLY